MKAQIVTCRPAAALRALPAPRRARASRAAPRLGALSDVGKYLGEAASQIFSPQREGDAVPWEKGSPGFAGKIVHHEETARLKALQLAVDSAVSELEKSIDEAPEGGEVPKQTDMGDVVTSTIQRVFGNNFKGDETEPKTWISTGYASAGRPRSQRELRHEYDRLTRFQSVVKKVVKEAEAANKDM